MLVIFTTNQTYFSSLMMLRNLFSGGLRFVSSCRCLVFNMVIND
jgi:hypothetical protein